MNETSVEPEKIPAPPPAASPRAAQLFDESVAADGTLRPHYAKFFSSLEPVGAVELERRWENSRRLARFFRHGHTQGKMAIPAPVENVDFPFTLDLRNV